MHWLRRHDRGRPPHPDVLTPAEWRVLKHVREGLPNAEIAVRLGISVNTVRVHVSNMLAKRELPDRQALAAWQGEPSEASRRALARTRLALPLTGWSTAARVVAAGGVATASAVLVWVAIGVASDGGVSGEVGTFAEEPTPHASDAGNTAPYRRVFAADEVIDVSPAVLFLRPHAITPDSGVDEIEAWVFPAHTMGGSFGVAPDGSYIIWYDGHGYRLFDTEDELDQGISASHLPVAFAADGAGFLAPTDADFVLTAFDRSGERIGDLSRGWNCGRGAAAWSSQAIATAGYCDGPLRLWIRTYEPGLIGQASSEPMFADLVPHDSNVALRWSHDGERLALVTAGDVRVLDRTGQLLWEVSSSDWPITIHDTTDDVLFEGDGGFWGNPRWSPDDQHLYVHAMPGLVAEVAYLFTADGRPLFRFISTGQHGCRGEVWVNDRAWFGQLGLAPDGSVIGVERPRLSHPDLDTIGVIVSDSIGTHGVYYADEWLRELDDGRLVVTTPATQHDGCADLVHGSDVRDGWEPAPAVLSPTAP
jgi:DNA-binding CsgD family transcriptional regulator